jgi:hypothetical protein
MAPFIAAGAIPGPAVLNALPELKRKNAVSEDHRNRFSEKSCKIYLIMSRKNIPLKGTERTKTISTFLNINLIDCFY